MYRTKTCGELRITDVDKQVTLSGWVQRVRRMGGMTFADLRDRYGITQLVFNEETADSALWAEANKLGREYVIQVTGTVNERSSKNSKIPTGEIEIAVSSLTVRPRRTGDRLKLAGRPAKTVKKWCIERKIPAHLRDGLPVLALDGRPAAVAGLGADESLLAEEGGAAWHIRVLPAEGEKSPASHRET